MIVSQVLGQVALLAEGHLATWYLACKWFLTSVHSQMVVEVMVFLKDLAAVLKFTFQDFLFSGGDWVGELKDSVVSGAWSVVIVQEPTGLVAVAVFRVDISRNHFDRGNCLWNVLRHLRISDILSVDPLKLGALLLLRAAQAGALTASKRDVMLLKG